ncbi:MAG: B12-binding domain-containing radical SAM protein [Hyphomicrobiales bacterium]|nr:MAG: B12-binding domain-containing radical SAM protein [Hyphomicrobiales bacterium]
MPDTDISAPGPVTARPATPEAISAGPCKVLFVHPQFHAGSFWNYREVCEFVGAKYPAPPLGLITVAAMLPKTWESRLVDRNVGELTDDDIAWADLIMTGGMLPQQMDALNVIRWAHRLGKPVAVGGPDPTSIPGHYEEADFKVLGEAEGILDEFIAAWERGERSGTFTAPKYTIDVTQTPVPRFDLLELDKYVHVNVQFSRGCPFTCEFCDIIELYGRVPRTKTIDQMLNELDALRDIGYRGHVDFVDDNLIGNKKAVKAFMPHLIDWQNRNKYPFVFSTEASLNLSDDEALLAQLSEANFFLMFIGIESPNEEVLKSTRKKQNTRRSIADSVHKFYAAGIGVLAGFIVGFDEEGEGTAEAIIELIEDSAIPVAMVGLLYALPNTQLTRRLEREGRMFPDQYIVEEEDPADQCVAGLNFHTKRPRQDVLSDYREVVSTVYRPENFFRRVRRASRMMKMGGRNGDMHMSMAAKDLSHFARLAFNITLRKTRFAPYFWQTLLYILFTNPRALVPTINLMALYVHLGPFASYVTREIDDQIQAVKSGEWQPPVAETEPAEAQAGVPVGARA